MLTINELIIYLNNELSNKTDYENENVKLFQDNAFINGITHHS